MRTATLLLAACVCVGAGAGRPGRPRAAPRPVAGRAGGRLRVRRCTRGRFGILRAPRRPVVRRRPRRRRADPRPGRAPHASRSPVAPDPASGGRLRRELGLLARL